MSLPLNEQLIKIKFDENWQEIKKTTLLLTFTINSTQIFV